MANLLFDLGHGGSDSGAVNGSRLEKNDVNIALRKYHQQDTR